MKELSIEEKAKAYDKAIEKAKNWYIDAQIDFKKSLETLFPSLKESEDEKIRKEIIEFLELPHPQFVGKRDHEEWIAWLEKQGEQKKSYDTCDSSMMDNKKSPYSEKRDFGYFEENPADKVEPKFKVGDWVVSDFNNVAYIESISETKYNLQCINGYHEKMSIEYIDRCWHLWTIQDAKDGDVLAISWWEDNNFWEKIIIFKKYHNKDVKGLYCMSCVEGYGNTFKNGKLAFNEKVPYYSKTWTCNLHPATKEQRDLLFQKMKEAGFEWDAEKKELKEIKSNPDNLLEESCKQQADDLIDKATEKSVWDKDDEDYFDAIVAKLEVTQEDAALTNNQMDFLKSLKERIQLQPKQEWSIEDENLFDFLHTCVCHGISDPYWAYGKRVKASKELIPFIEKLKALYYNEKLREDSAKLEPKFGNNAALDMSENYKS